MSFFFDKTKFLGQGETDVSDQNLVFLNPPSASHLNPNLMQSGSNPETTKPRSNLESELNPSLLTPNFNPKPNSTAEPVRNLVSGPDHNDLELGSSSSTSPVSQDNTSGLVPNKHRVNIHESTEVSPGGLDLWIDSNEFNLHKRNEEII